jgi:hypothetical protein
MRFFLLSMSLGVAVLSLNGCFTISDDDSSSDKGGSKNGSGGSTESGGSGGSTAGGTTGANGGSGGDTNMAGRTSRAGSASFLGHAGRGGSGSGGERATTGGSAGKSEAGGSGGSGDSSGAGDTGASGGTGGTGGGGTSGKGGSSGMGGSGGTGGSSSTPGGTCADYSQHLVDCAVIDKPILCDSLGSDPASPCRYACYEAASCTTITAYTCNSAENSLNDCLTACDTFPCGNGDSVPSDFVCDGVSDCTNGADEKGCVAAPAFHCKSGGTVDGSYRCDGYPDCSDGSDEAGCPMNTCPRPMAPDPGAACADATSTLKGCGLLPGGIMTGCLDRTEYTACERECLAHGSCADLTAFLCTSSGGDTVQACLDGCSSQSDNFPCTTGTDVVPGSYVCDDVPDCADGSDEDNCTFKCATGGQSISLSYTCDGYSDCADGSDEMGCSATCN